MVRQSILKQGKRPVLIVIQLLVAFICLIIGLGMVQATQRDIHAIRKITPPNMVHLATFMTDKANTKDVSDDSISIDNLKVFYNTLKENNAVGSIGSFVNDTVIAVNNNIKTNREWINIIYMDDSLIKMSNLKVSEGKDIKYINEESANSIPVWIGSELAKENPIGTMIKVTINGDVKKQLVIAGILEKGIKFWNGNGTFLSNSLINMDYSMIAPMQKEQDSGEAFTARILRNTVIQLKDISKKSNFNSFVQKNAQKELNNSGFTFKVIDSQMEEEQIIEKNKVQTVFIIALAIMLLVLSSFGLLGVILASILRRKRELGVRYAIGSTPKHLALLVFGEIVLLYVFSGVIALILSFIMSAFFSENLPIDINPLTILYTFGVVLIFSLATALMPIISVLRLEPVEMINGGNK